MQTATRSMAVCSDIPWRGDPLDPGSAMAERWVCMTCLHSDGQQLSLSWHVCQLIFSTTEELAAQ